MRSLTDMLIEMRRVKQLAQQAKVSGIDPYDIDARIIQLSEAVEKLADVVVREVSKLCQESAK